MLRSRAAVYSVVCCLLVVARAGADEPKTWQQPAEAMPVAAPGAAADKTEKPSTAQPFAVPAGFRVERLFVVPKNELGSWVCLATDPQGRLLASDQGDKGLVRITPAPLDGSKPTIVEKIPVPLTAAQGLLWAFDALYVVCNGGPGSGLYRVTDSDSNDTLDKVEKLREFPGSGEHGPHNILLSPDGTRLFIICGNHTKLPFAMKNVTEPQTMGGIRSTQRRVELPPEASSRLPANWDEDQMITRMWDANGHAVGILAPGGYVVSTDPAGKEWEIWTAGYRNPYDFGFNADGELFVYDADMEWDFGTPWYRPTRVNHATSGSELGWRSGTGKWPARFPDSLPALVDIGPGSPVGAAFGYGAKVPAKYQKAFFICDWTFGTMYAIHLEPDGSTYRGVKEEFVSRTPLPLTDMTIGKDGAIYFAVGGRGSQSELYRVTYAGTESTAPVDAKSTANAAERKVRRDLEAFHKRVADPGTAIAAALPQLASSDRFIRYAARIALEHQPVELWQEQALAVQDPRGLITAAIGVARQAEPSAQAAVLTALDRVDPRALDTAGQIDLVRAYELALIRLGAPSAAAQARIAARLSPLFPAGSFDLDRELSSLLVTVQAPGIVSKLVGLLSAPSASAGSTNLAPSEDDLRRLIERNAGYGGSVRAALEKRSDLLQVHYAYALRTVTDKAAWTLADRKGYYAWFGRARAWAGGNSYRKFLANIETESLAGLTENEKLALETLGARKPYTPPPLPKPEGPGRPWTIEEVLAAAAKPDGEGLAKGRDFEHGKRTFAAARCIVCHRYGEDGGATGPDMTQAGGRFQVRDMVEAIVHPSKVVSDQYKASIVQTADGKVFTGRIVSESPEQIVVVTDPEDATKFVELVRTDVEEITSSPMSLMPQGLLDQLNENEVLDLLAYTLSRGNPRDPRFTKRAAAPVTPAPAAAAFTEPVAPAPAPIAHWTFDEPDGAEARDAVGGHHGTVHGAKPHKQGVIDRARLFVRDEGHHVEVRYHRDFDIPSFTVSAWIWLTEPPAYSGILGTRHGGDHTFDVKVNADQVHGDIGTGGNWIQTAVNFGARDVGTDGQGGRLKVGRWYLVTYVIDDAAKQCRLYLGGDLKKTIPYKGTPRLMKSDQTLRIGCSSHDEFMDGVIDDVKIWNLPLTDAQVRSLARP
ncbi:MAG: LamG-like jellyroll fold domain-containing protein [Planctomycetota bacterium]